MAYAEKAYKNGQYEESKKVYEEIIKVYPNSSQANKGLLRLEKVINNDRIQKNLTQEQINSVVSLYKNGQFQEAVDSIKTLNKSYPNVPLLFNLLGACYKSLGQIDYALQMFETATKIKPDYAEAFFNFLPVPSPLPWIPSVEFNISISIVISTDKFDNCPFILKLHIEAILCQVSSN